MCSEKACSIPDKASERLRTLVYNLFETGGFRLFRSCDPSAANSLSGALNTFRNVLLPVHLTVMARRYVSGPPVGVLGGLVSSLPPGEYDSSVWRSYTRQSVRQTVGKSVSTLAPTVTKSTGTLFEAENYFKGGQDRYSILLSIAR